MDVSAFIESITSTAWYSQQIVHLEDIESRIAEYGVLEDPLAPKLQKTLESIGVDSLMWLWPLNSSSINARMVALPHRRTQPVYCTTFYKYPGVYYPGIS